MLSDANYILAILDRNNVAWPAEAGFLFHLQ